MNGAIMIPLLAIGVVLIIILGEKTAYWVGGWWEDRKLDAVWRRERALRTLREMHDHDETR